MEEFVALNAGSFKSETSFMGELAKMEIDETKVFCLKPSTFMNLSGNSVQRVVQFFKIKTEDVLVVSDDAAIDFGVLRLKPKGSSGGHNGLKNIESKIGPFYPRLRMGIGYPERGSLEDFVLKSFTKEEEQHLDLFVREGADAVAEWIKQGLQVVMNQINTQKN